MRLWTLDDLQVIPAGLEGIIYDGWVRRICGTSMRFPMALQPFDLNEVYERLRPIVAASLVGTETYEHFNDRSGLITHHPVTVEYVLNGWSKQISDRAKRLNPSLWKAVRPRLSNLSQEQQRALHAQRQADVATMVARIDVLLTPFERAIEIERDAAEATALEQLRLAQAAETARLAEVAAAHRARPAPAPAAQPYGISPRGAEFLVRDWMRHLGLLSAEVTVERSDGGIDVDSDLYVAQVKHYRGSVSVVELRELFGVATAMGKQPLFFTSGSYTNSAVSFGEALEVPLFVYDAEAGTLLGANPFARRAIERGLAEVPAA